MTSKHITTAAQFSQYADKNLYKVIEGHRDRRELKQLMYKCFMIGCRVGKESK